MRNPFRRRRPLTTHAQPRPLADLVADDVRRRRRAAQIAAQARLNQALGLNERNDQ